ncbi:Retrovirus-related Pol polyprotein, partial [Schistosoma japonicum]
LICCLLSPFLFLLVVDWIMKTSTSEEKHGIQWTSRMQLDDLDFADDLALLSHTQQQMQVKTTKVAATSASIGLNIHKGKSKILKFNTESTDLIELD